MVHVTEKAREQVREFFSKNKGLERSIRIYLQEGG
jgi:Fe-S cluster assembly iron-binding protein IscA